MGANSVKKIFEDSQRSGCTDALAQAAPSLALALKRQKGKKKPDTRVSASIRSNEITTIQFYITVILASLAGNFLILALCQGCQLFLAQDLVCPCHSQILRLIHHGKKDIVFLIVQERVPGEPHKLHTDIRPDIQRDTDRNDMP